MPDNAAAWITDKYARLAVQHAPYTSPRENEMVVRNHAVAVNPVDWITQVTGGLGFGWLKYPFVPGSDVAGEVVEVGRAVTRFKVGERVVGHALGASKARHHPAEGGFQRYTVLVDYMASPIPADLPYENAAVVPLGISTAACGLFETDQLGLQHPSMAPRPTGKTVLVWGGSTSVGSNAIQLALAAGYEVIATASPRNFDHCRRLGAAAVFDYQAKSVVREAAGALNGKTIAGALAIGQGSASPCLDIVARCKGDRVVSIASPAVSFAGLPAGGGGGAQLAGLIAQLVGSMAALSARSRLAGVRLAHIFGDTLASNEVGPMIYRDFLPAALAAGAYVASPEPLIAGEGLDQIQAALDLQRKGVSARKVVVRL